VAEISQSGCGSGTPGSPRSAGGEANQWNGAPHRADGSTDGTAELRGAEELRGIDEPLRVLSPDGTPTGTVRAPYPAILGTDRHRRMLTDMIVTRRLDTELVHLQRQGQLALYASCLGQEAAQVGVAAAMRDEDWLFPQYRQLGMFVARGVDPVGVAMMWRGAYHGGRGLLERRSSPVCIVVGANALHATGYALGVKLDAGDEVVVAALGDGALSEGDVHEAFNMAAVFGVPCLFVVENNQWAISVPGRTQTKSTTLAQKAVAYGMPGVRCDGNDVLATYSVASDALRRIRAGGGPVLLELVTYRRGAHTTSDDPTRYRDEAEVERWTALDPLDRYRRHLGAEGIWGTAEEQQATAAADEAAARVRAEVYDAGDPSAAGLFDLVFAKPTKELERQRAQLERELSRGRP
jgi:2-oxoisovalerate dehydrogenase E1 component subunit alpha